MLENERHLFRVTDLKEYTFCPRVLYYENCLPDLRPSTFKMQAGVTAHEREREKAARRTMKAYKLPPGERHFDVVVRNDELGLVGEIDEVVVTNAGVYIVDYKLAWKSGGDPGAVDTPDAGVYIVDYKLAWKIGSNFKLQVAAYALLLESAWQIRVSGVFIYLIPKREAVPVNLTARLKQQVKMALIAMRQIVEDERMPPPATNTRQCSTCKHRRFCNDV